MPRRTPYGCRCKAEDDTIAVSIQDDGIGFDRSWCGVGAVGMEERVAHMGGRFQIDSEPGSGTLLTAELPVPPTVSTVPKSRSIVRMMANTAARTLRILLADDHTVVRNGLRLILERQPSFDVIGEAADGRASSNWRLPKLPDVVVMDIGMPG